MINNIIHISDIHIRTGDSKKSRYDEYINVFDNLYDSISQQPSIIHKSAIIAITGDIFHNKNKIGPAGIKIATYLLQKLSLLANVIIIRGNHDYRQDHPTEHDMISALMSYDIPNVLYLDKTGIHTYKNINFGIVAIQETLLYGSTSGIAGKLPDFPKPKQSSTQHNIALFHGTINGTTLQNGSRTTLDGYPIDWFQGYDAILLGDVHLQQINRAILTENQTCILPHTTICQTYIYDKQVPWGYSGSLIQQDFGETIKGHGYALWNLQDKIISVYHIKNPNGMIKLHYKGNINDIEVEHKQYIKPITKTASLEKIILTKWFPDNLHIRISGDNISSELIQLITQKIKSYGKVVLSITNKSISKSLEQEEANEDKDISATLLDINSSDTLIQYIQNVLKNDNKTLKTEKWKQWLANPDSIRIPTENIPDTIVSKLVSKLNTLDKSITTFTEEFDKIKTQQIITGELTLHKLEWNWILNYKRGNMFDFDKNTKSISILNAKNGNGKSNFLEIICIALFGEGFPSRYNKNYTSNIICDKKPDGVMASTCISFTLNGDTFILERTMRNQSLKRSIKFEDVILYTLVNGEKNILHQKSNAVDTWVEKYIGKCDMYLMSAMLSQNADSDFFSLDNASQKKLLDKVLSLDHINSLQKLLKDSVSYYKTTADFIESYYDGVKSKTYIVDQKYIDELNTYQSELDIISQTKRDLHSKWHMVSNKSLSEIKNISDLQNIISELQKYIYSLPTQNPDEIRTDILHVNNSIQHLTNELSKFHLFSDLDNINEKNENIDLKQHKNTIAQLDLALKLHPYNKKKEFSIYDKLTNISNKIKNKIENENNEEIDKLVELICDFENWNKIQIQKYTQDNKYFQNNSEIEKLQLNISSLISIIQEYPEQISKITKQITKLRKEHTKLTKDKDLCSDRRPNKPTKTKEWLQQFSTNISENGDLVQLKSTKLFLETSIQKIPIICIKIDNTIQKMSEYKQYIKDCQEYPFNPECDACRLQPWRTKYDTLINELPIIQNQLNDLEHELNPLKYDKTNSKLLYSSYSSYLKELKIIHTQICNNISELELYNDEKSIWNKWERWETEYNAIKKQYDELSNDINNLDTQKRKLETVLEKARLDKQNLQTTLEDIQIKKQEYDLYIAELDIRQNEYNLTKNKLDLIWYSTLYKYRREISLYIGHIKNEISLLEKRKIELKEILDGALEREKQLSIIEDKRCIYEAYPHWIQWTKLHSTEKELTLKINELQIRIKGASTGTRNEEMIKCLMLLQDIKEDYDDLLYISSAFDGYREWHYNTNIAPIIQNRVNSVLELICDERPLYLECEWLDAINTLSWFIRDGSSRVIIQKASGFQRFIAGIAMRVAINQIGLSRIRFSEFFIDEGFTACDSDNLERVPEFLKGLLRFYGSIYLATHLEDLKCCADKHIFIKRDDNGLSLIQHGDAVLIKEIEDKVATITASKKRGRPTKASLIVNRI